MWPFLTHGKFNVVIVIRSLRFLYRLQERPGTSMTLQPENRSRKDEYIPQSSKGESKCRKR